jgi:hypothetical protein
LRAVIALANGRAPPERRFFFCTPADAEDDTALVFAISSFWEVGVEPGFDKKTQPGTQVVKKLLYIA